MFIEYPAMQSHDTGFKKSLFVQLLLNVLCLVSSNNGIGNMMTQKVK